VVPPNMEKMSVSGAKSHARDASVTPQVSQPLSTDEAFSISPAPRSCTALAAGASCGALAQPVERSSASQFGRYLLLQVWQRSTGLRKPRVGFSVIGEAEAPSSSGANG